jgi:hypothetical protein
MPADAIRYFFDHNMWGSVTAGLRRFGIDVQTAEEAGLAEDDDPALLSFATAQGRMLVTFDKDFLRWHATGMAHAGIAWCPLTKYRIGPLIDQLRLVHGVFTAAEVENHLEYL